MELLYHIDEKDKVLGSVERDRAHKEVLLHRSGTVILVNSDNKILVQHRSPEKKTFPDLEDLSCAFHVPYGETYEQAAQRELLEETGTTGPVRYIGKFTHNDPPEYETVAVFISRSDEPVRINEESTGFKFLEKGEVDNMVAKQKITPWFGPAWRIARAEV